MQNGSFLTSYFQVPDNINLLQFYLNFEKKKPNKEKNTWCNIFGTTPKADYMNFFRFRFLSNGPENFFMTASPSSVTTTGLEYVCNSLRHSINQLQTELNVDLIPYLLYFIPEVIFI